MRDGIGSKFDSAIASAVQCSGSEDHGVAGRQVKSIPGRERIKSEKENQGLARKLGGCNGMRPCDKLLLFLLPEGFVLLGSPERAH